MRFFSGMFKARTPAPLAEAPKPRPERLPPEAVARLQREAEEARIEEERTRASAERIERACRTFGFWWPGDSYSLPESRLSPRSWRSRLVERIFETWR